MGVTFIPPYARFETNSQRQVQVSSHPRFLERKVPELSPSPTLSPHLPSPSAEPPSQKGKSLLPELEYFLHQYCLWGTYHPFSLPSSHGTATTSHQEVVIPEDIPTYHTKHDPHLISATLRFLALDVGKFIVYSLPITTPQGVRFTALLAARKDTQIQALAFLLLQPEELLPLCTHLV